MNLEAIPPASAKPGACQRLQRRQDCADTPTHHCADHSQIPWQLFPVEKHSHPAPRNPTPSPPSPRRFIGCEAVNLQTAPRSSHQAVESRCASLAAAYGSLASETNTVQRRARPARPRPAAWPIAKADDQPAQQLQSYFAALHGFNFRASMFGSDQYAHRAFIAVKWLIVTGARCAMVVVVWMEKEGNLGIQGPRSHWAR